MMGGINMREIKANMAGSIWKVNITEGETIQANQEVIILESMKMEIPISSDMSGIVQQIKVTEGDFVNEGDVLVIIR